MGRADLKPELFNNAKTEDNQMLTLGWEIPGLSLLPGNQEYDQEELAVLAELKNILELRRVKTVFQPIVSLADGHVMGYEALSRGPQGSPLEWPDKLFQAAEKFNKVWDLELLCRVKALDRARTMKQDKMLFINVDPNIIHDGRFQKGLTKDMLSQYQINATNIIFEITEKTSVSDYRAFRRVLDNYISQGYKIALDDTGSGYSGLKLLTETRPQFVKIDMDLVRDIDKDSLKQALMKAFHEFSLVTNIKIIAEGIETVDELNTLIGIGISYGQGYLLQRPASEFLEVPTHIKDLIKSRNIKKKQEQLHTTITMPIGEIARANKTFLPSTLGREAIDYFNANPNVLGVPVVQDGVPLGLLMKDKFLTNLATQYGVAVYMNRPIGLLMDRNPLIVSFNTPLEHVSKSAITRSEDTLYDYIIVILDGQYHGITTVKDLLAKTTQLEVSRAKYSNPLSGLPGNIIIESKLKQTIDENIPFSVLYFDIDNFKAYNDVYGFENGDKILCLTAQIIQQQLKTAHGQDSFLGHIGGDDFIAILHDTDIEKICQAIIDSFDVRVRGFYNEQDRDRGYIITANRHNIAEKYPLVTLSVAVVTAGINRFSSPTEIAEKAGKVKKQCKLIWQSCYCID